MASFAYRTLLWMLVLAVAFVPCLNAQNATGTNCLPTSCPTKCNLACPTDQVCTLGMMTQCGICPTSRCVPKTVIKIPTNDPSTTQEPADSPKSENKGAMIGGIVGGLVGGALLFGSAAYCVVTRHRQKSSFLPFTFTNSLRSQGRQRNTGDQNAVGMIPISYVPPSLSQHTASTPNYHAPAPAAVAAAAAATARTLSSTAPRPASSVSQHAGSHHLTVGDNRASRYETDDDGGTVDLHSSRTSVASSVSNVSNVSNQPVTPVKATQAIQISRARPQVMRVNQVVVGGVPSGTASTASGASGLSRSGSVRTILTRDNSIRGRLARSNTAPSRHFANSRRTSALQNHLSTASATDDPFHDRHSVNLDEPPATIEINPQSAQNLTNGDGEIILMWNGRPVSYDMDGNIARISASQFPRPPPSF